MGNIFFMLNCLELFKEQVGYILNSFGAFSNRRVISNNQNQFLSILIIKFIIIIIIYYNNNNFIKLLILNNI